MPTYEYRCKACDHEFEVVQSFTDDALTECPECEGPHKKVFGNVGITFKGSGFYKNDSGSRSSGRRPTKTNPTSESASTGSETSTSSTSETKSETKPGSKSDSKGESKPASTAPKTD